MKPFRTRGLVRRATPILIILAVFAVQVGADLRPVLAFPLYLAAVLMAALYLGRVESLAAGVVAGLAILGPSIAGSDKSGDTTSALLLAAVLVVVAVVVYEVVGRIRGAAADAAAKLAEAEAQEERFRITVEAAQVGLALIAPSGAWLQVNERLCVILGRSRAELL